MNWRYFQPVFHYDATIDTSANAWSGHRFFIYDFVRNIQPKTIVELGAHHGNSFFAMAQAIKDEGYSAQKIVAIDTWQGDHHAGLYDDSVYENFLDIYRSYFQLLPVIPLRKTFSEALSEFSDGSIDVLHIDGLHTYDAVKHDFETWFPKVKNGGYIIFHDIAEFQKDFGVFQLWDELKNHYPHISFYHSHGLGILIKGDSPYIEFLKNQEKIWNLYYDTSYRLVKEQKENKGLRSQNSLLQESYREQEYQIENLNKNILALQEYHHILENKFADAIQENKSLEQISLQQQDTIQLLEQNILSSQEKYKTLENELGNTSALKNTLYQELMSAQEKNNHLEYQINAHNQHITWMSQSVFWRMRAWYIVWKNLFTWDIINIIKQYIFGIYWALRNPLKFIRKYIWKKCPSYHQLVWAIKNPKRFLYKYKTGHYNNILKIDEIVGVTVIDHYLPTESDFSELCIRLLHFLPKTFPTISKNSTKKSVIVETRVLAHTEFVIKNTIQKLGDGWGHIVFCSKENHKQIIEICKSISSEIEILLLPYEIRSRNDYNNFCLDDFFWKSLHCEKVFIYQTDTILLKEFDPMFLEYDYIGGPWGDHHARHIEWCFNIANLYCGNGGLSLRNVSVMREFLNLYELPSNKKFDQMLEKIPEDTFFSMYTLLKEKKYPSLQIAWEFASEFELNPTSFGLHQPWKFFQSSIEMQRHIEKIFFQKNKKRILFINHEESATGAPRLLYDLILKEQEIAEFDIWTISLKVINNPWNLKNLLYYDDIPGNSTQEKINYITDVLNPDLVYANTIVALDFAKEFDCKKIISIHEYRSIFPYYLSQEIFDLKRFDKVIVACSQAKNILEHCKIDADIIPYYYLNYYNKEIQVHNTNNQEYILGIGHVQFRKGIDRFIELAQLLPKEKFVWIGSLDSCQIIDNSIIMEGYNFQTSHYKLGEPIVPITISLEIPPNVSFVGLYATEKIIKDWLPCAKCVLMLSTDDPFPLVVIESKLYNRNVVTIKDAGDSYKVCSDSDLILDSYDSDSIVHYIQNLSFKDFEYNIHLAQKLEGNFFQYHKIIKNLLTQKTKVFTAIDSDSSENSYLLLEKTLKSLEKNNTDIEIKVLTDKITHRARKIKTQAEFIVIQSKVGSFIKGVYNENPAVAGSYYRIEIPSVCKEKGYDDDYVLYCDYDILSDKNITRFLPRGGIKYFAATPEWFKNDTSYYNSGVMWINIQGFRKKYEELVDFIFKNAHTLSCHDQDALNHVFYGLIQNLDNRLNWKPYWGNISDIGILHFHWLKPDMDLEKKHISEKIKNNFKSGMLDISAVKKFFTKWKIS